MSWSLRLSFLIAPIALASSLAGIFIPGVYAKEAPNWAGQAVGQDVANLVAYLAMLALAAGALRGSTRAFLGWLGVVAYSIYTYAIYAFALHFGPLFVAYVVVLGLSIYALIGAIAGVDAGRVRRAFSVSAPRRSTAAVLVLIGSLFSLLWLSEIVPATIAGAEPPSLTAAGLASNPVYVLDLAVLLPGAIVAGALLWRDRAWGYVLAPMLLGALVLLSVGIVAAFAVLAARGEAIPVVVAGVIAGIALGQLAVLIRFLRSAEGAAVPTERSIAA